MTAARATPWRPWLAVVLVPLVACAVHAGKPDKEERMLEQGLSLLQSKDTAAICRGAGLLGELGRSEAIEPLLALMKTRDETARECVREALAKLDVAPVLLAKWRNNDATTKDEALEHAVGLPHPGLMALYGEAAADPVAKRRRRVATGLRRQAEGPEVWRMLEALVGDGDDDVRWWAIDTLGLSKAPEAAKILRARLATEPDEGLKTFIKRSLGEPE